MKLSLFLVSAAVAVSMNNHVSMVHAVESNDTNAMNEDDTMGYISTISMEELVEDECEMGVASMPPTEAPTPATATDVPTPVQPSPQNYKRAGVKGVKTTGEGPTPSPKEKDGKHDDKHGKKDKKGKKEHKHHKHGDEGEHMDDVSMEENGSSGNNRPFRMNQPNKNEEEAEEEAQKKNGLLNCCGIADCVGDVKDKIPFINKC
mmetsp:Transcript_1704/g.2714  ORF Transcript_1704/g.2714 Transcript_1704/m.2714 type:complete len:204 (-) Transcript_1704:174-785(-)|eukprot:CAMPEP_0195298026 /NCGR_PEP_ID=MMETSP0707-20130614/22596_1 /TAXON_ID=33640 /ORGANISM="Asterionellopsis glacialis, Strain CCMP134" /LENGTH=203 /DNA_ID=CAMNT_0040359995 /DNA_START=69 /DNA_END=680 /DNA_ORIENTATION=-